MEIIQITRNVAETASVTHARSRFMSDIPMRPADDEGNVAAWGRHVSDDDYAHARALEEGGR